MIPLILTRRQQGRVLLLLVGWIQSVEGRPTPKQDPWATGEEAGTRHVIANVSACKALGFPHADQQATPAKSCKPQEIGVMFDDAATWAEHVHGFGGNTCRLPPERRHTRHQVKETQSLQADTRKQVEGGLVLDQAGLLQQILAMQAELLAKAALYQAMPNVAALNLTTLPQMFRQQVQASTLALQKQEAPGVNGQGRNELPVVELAETQLGMMASLVRITDNDELRRATATFFHEMGALHISGKCAVVVTFTAGLSTLTQVKSRLQEMGISLSKEDDLRKVQGLAVPYAVCSSQRGQSCIKILYRRAPEAKATLHLYTARQTMVLKAKKCVCTDLVMKQFIKYFGKPADVICLSAIKAADEESPLAKRRRIS
ncbi:unnamed protein product [Polarella glacialis]|uniref:Uncharacterized protein n=1 Tax=Polarella glacialis TaxID=89957 RepID=A0A813H449_POLGL|nr:unnamed protein product [Polarella glacialis]